MNSNLVIAYQNFREAQAQLEQAMSEESAVAAREYYRSEARKFDESCFNKVLTVAGEMETVFFPRGCQTRFSTAEQSAKVRGWINKLSQITKRNET